MGEPKVTKVLIIDNSPEDIELLIDLICQDHPNFEFSIAKDGRGGVESMGADRPNCILLDYRLDHESGLDLLPKFLAIDEACPVIMLTGRGSEAIAAQAIKAGASDYLVKKDVTGTDLRKAIEHAVMREDMKNKLASQEQDLRRQGRLEALGHLSAGVAHDFNNILATIRFGVEGLKRAVITQKSIQKLDIILRTVDRAAERTQGLLAFASQQVGRLSDELCSHVLAEIEALSHDAIATTCGIEFRHGVRDVLVHCDQALLQNALLNLIVNARDAIQQTDKAGTIIVESKVVERADVGRMVEFIVQDDGIGIPADLIEQVTDPYFTTKAATGGTGIGLSMVHGFVTQSGGSLRIHSEVGKGTTVRFTVPVGSVACAGSVKLGPTTAQDSMRTRRVLLVEDQFWLGVMIKDELEEAGFEVLMTASAENALTMMDQICDADAVVTDISLNGVLDGFDLAERTREKHPGIQIIGMSGFQHFDATKKRQVLDVLLLKPFETSDMTDELKRFRFGSKCGDRRRFDLS